MNSRTLVPVVLTLLAAACAAAVLSAPATAAPDTIYCVNGVSTTLPTTVTASSVTGIPQSFALSFDESQATTAITLHGGTAYAGYRGAPINNWYVFFAPFAPGAFEAGYTQIQVSLGACTTGGATTVVPAVAHVGVCKLLPRADGTTGLFQQISVAEWNDPGGRYFDAPAASWVDGLGLTCDDAVGLGYTPPAPGSPGREHPRSRPQRSARLRFQQHLPPLHAVDQRDALDLWYGRARLRPARGALRRREARRRRIDDRRAGRRAGSTSEPCITCTPRQRVTGAWHPVGRHGCW